MPRHILFRIGRIFTMFIMECRSKHTMGDRTLHLGNAEKVIPSAVSTFIGLLSWSEFRGKKSISKLKTISDGAIATIRLALVHRVYIRRRWNSKSASKYDANTGDG